MIICYEQLPSTQSQAGYLLKNHNNISEYLQLNNFFAVNTKHQTNGYGRNRNSWFGSEEDFYVSYVLSRRIVFYEKLLTITIGMVVYNFIADIIAKYSSYNDSLIDAIKIKWPNDLLINGKKVCGIISEKKQDYYIIGVGINFIYQKLLDTCSLQEFVGQKISQIKPNFCAKDLGQRIEKKLMDIENQQDYHMIVNDFQALCYGFGNDWIVDNGQERINGKMLGINHDGALILQTASGNKFVESGHVIDIN